MSDENRYVKADLEDHANFDRITVDTDGYASPSRKECLTQALGVDTLGTRTVSKGGYQGTVVHILTTGGYIWLVKDSYGSCSGCDSWLAADDIESYRNYVRRMCRNAYAFETTDDAVEFLEDKRGDGTEMSTFAYGWGPLVEEAIEILESV